MIEAKETEYNGEYFRSRIEARWAMVFDELEIEWEYEPQHYELGLKNAWDEEDEEQLEEDLQDEWDEETIDEIRREAWWKKHEKVMYLPDFWLSEMQCWIEIKGKSPTAGEETKARRLSLQTRKPVHILWGYIPDPKASLWGECSEVYGGKTGIIALLVIECGVKAVEKAFTLARQARF